MLNIIIPTYGNTTIQKGQPYNYNYLIEWIGIFQNQAEIDAGPKHPYNPKPGDLKYKDQLTIDKNGDGIMDTTDNIIDSKDRVVVPGVYPKFYYGGGINVYLEKLRPNCIPPGHKRHQKVYVNETMQ